MKFYSKPVNSIEMYFFHLHFTIYTAQLVRIFTYVESYCQYSFIIICIYSTEVNKQREYFPMFDGVGLVGFKSRANSSLLAQAALSLLQYSSCFPFCFFLSIGWYCGAGVFGLIGCIPLSLSLALPTFFNNNNNNINQLFILHAVQYKCPTPHLYYLSHFH